MNKLKTTSLNDVHKHLGARMVPFAGWEMPVQYEGIIAESNAVRKKSGIFDVSHMGRVLFSGSDASNLLDSVLSVQVTDMKIGQARYTVICNSDGFIIDDCIVYRLMMELFLLIPNASNRANVLDWISRFVTKDMDLGISDVTSDTAMIAIQGPLAESIISIAITEERIFQLQRSKEDNDIEIKKLLKLRPFHVGSLFFGEVGIDESNFFGNPDDNSSQNPTGLIARTGYTGEDGFEIMIHRSQSEKIWTTLQKLGAIPAGLGSRDLLRLEAGMVLYGNDIDLTTNPYEVGLGKFVKPDRTGYVARDSLLNFQKFPTGRTLVGFRMEIRNIPRHGYSILANNTQIGEVTSGVFSPDLGISIGMGFVQKQFSEIGTVVQIDIRGKLYDAQIVKMPFYIRS